MSIGKRESRGGRKPEGCGSELKGSNEEGVEEEPEEEGKEKDEKVLAVRGKRWLSWWYGRKRGGGGGEEEEEGEESCSLQGADSGGRWW